MKVLVCGGRDYNDGATLRRCLDALMGLQPPITQVIHGGATGADTMAGTWAQHRGIPVTVYKADWSLHGRAAGPRRNEKMLHEGKPDLVVAFPGGRGTAHMVRIATEAGVKVVHAPAEQSTDIEGSA